MRADRGEEAAMLLSAYQQAAQRDAASMRQRRRAIRTLFGVVGVAALVVGCIAVVDVLALNGAGNAVDTMTLDVTTGDEDAVAMEAQFGWNSIGYGWCSIKSSTWCMFSKDKDKCKDNIDCYKNRENARASDSSGSGSGSFANVTVGDSSTDVEVGWDDDSSAATSDSKEEAPAAHAENPTEPLDLPSSGGGKDADMGGED